MKSTAAILIVVCVSLSLMDYYGTPVRKYVGIVESVDKWTGHCSLRAKQENGTDTVLEVYPLNNQQFTSGEVITVWVGGKWGDNVPTTNPR